MDGVPCIRNMRVPVHTVLTMLANGLSIADVVELHPTLEPEDVREALHFAADVVAQVKPRGVRSS